MLHIAFTTAPSISDELIAEKVTIAPWMRDSGAVILAVGAVFEIVKSIIKTGPSSWPSFGVTIAVYISPAPNLLSEIVLPFSSVMKPFLIHCQDVVTVSPLASSD